MKVDKKTQTLPVRPKVSKPETTATETSPTKPQGWTATGKQRALQVNADGTVTPTATPTVNATTRAPETIASKLPPVEVLQAVHDLLFEAQDNTLDANELSGFLTRLSGLSLSPEARDATAQYLGALKREHFASDEDFFAASAALAKFADRGQVSTGAVTADTRLGSQVGLTSDQGAPLGIVDALNARLLNHGSAETRKLTAGADGALPPEGLDSREVKELQVLVKQLPADQQALAQGFLSTVPADLVNAGAATEDWARVLGEAEPSRHKGTVGRKVLNTVATVGWGVKELVKLGGTKLANLVGAGPEARYNPLGFDAVNEKYSLPRSIAVASADEKRPLSQWLESALGANATGSEIENGAEGAKLYVFADAQGQLRVTHTNDRSNSESLEWLVQTLRGRPEAKTAFLQPLPGEGTAAFAQKLATQLRHIDDVPGAAGVKQPPMRSLYVESDDARFLEAVRSTDPKVRIKLDLDVEGRDGKRKRFQKKLQPDVIGFSGVTADNVDKLKHLSDIGFPFVLDGADPALIASTGAFGASGTDAASWPKAQHLIDDASQLTETRVNLARPQTADEVKRLVDGAIKRGQKVSISGRRHTMHGHTFKTDGLVLDLNSFDKILGPPKIEKLSDGTTGPTLEVEAGAHWNDVVKYLDTQNLSPLVQQSHNIFTIGGSMAVNAHGRNVKEINGKRFGTIASMVESFDILTVENGASVMKHCSPTENKDLFAAAMGGYGMYGVIMKAKIRLQQNVAVTKKTISFPAEEFPEQFRKYVKEGVDGVKPVQMVGRLQVGHDFQLANEGLMSLVYETEGQPPPIQPYHASKDEMRKTVLRIARHDELGPSSQIGNRVRWVAERNVGPLLAGDESKKVSSLNNELTEGIQFLMPENREDLGVGTEFFIPDDSKEQFKQFIDDLRRLTDKYKLPTINITVRHVAADDRTLMKYAEKDSFALMVLLMKDGKPEWEKRLAGFTREMCDRYKFYLPYRVNYTPEALKTQYRDLGAALELKKKYGGDVFDSEFLEANRKKFAEAVK